MIDVNLPYEKSLYLFLGFWVDGVHVHLFRSLEQYARDTAGNHCVCSYQWNRGGLLRTEKQNLLVFGPQQFGNGCQLDQTGALVNGSNLAVAVKLFLRELLHKTDATHPFNAVRSSALSHLRIEVNAQMGTGGGSTGHYETYPGGVQFCHGSFLHEGLTGLLQAGSIVDHVLCCFDFHGDLSHLVLHALEVANVVVELLALPQVWQGGFHAAFSDTQHLRRNADAALIQNFNGNLVAFADLANNVFFRHL